MKKHYYLIRWLDNIVLVGMDYNANNNEVINEFINGISYDSAYYHVVIPYDKIRISKLLTSDSILYYMTHNYPYITKHGVVY